MESCVASDITNHVVTRNLLDNRQWAYRKGKSTEKLLIHLKERWREAVEKKLYVGILFVDFTKAFDTVSQNILLQKLNDIRIRGDIWLWLKNYLTERRQVVRINGCDSDTYIVTHWVPQGSVLGKQWSCSGNQHLLALSKLLVLATTSIIKWTTSERLLGVQVDNKLPWSDHAANVAKSFASKLSLLRRMR